MYWSSEDIVRKNEMLHEFKLVAELDLSNHNIK